MGTIRKTNPNLAKQPQSIRNSDDLDTQSPSTSGEEKDGHKDEVDWVGKIIPLDGKETKMLDIDGEKEIQVDPHLLNLNGETQETEDLDCDDENLGRMLVCDSEDDGGGGSDRSNRTEVLSDGSGDESEGGEGVCEQGGDSNGVDADCEVDRQRSSGSAQRSFMSVRTAALRASGQAAARSMTPKKTDSEATSITSNFQSSEKHIDVGTGTDGTIDPTSVGTKTRETYPDHEASDEKKLGVSNSTVRKLFASDENNLLVNDGNDISNDVSEVPEFRTCIAGLSYLGSEEPGEMSQANALNAVDMFITGNPFGFSQEDAPVKAVKGLLPPSKSAKRPQSLAKIIGTRSPVREADMYNWVDSHEDEGGGDFFIKSKEAYSGPRGCAKRSRAQSRKSVDVEFSKASCIAGKPIKKLKESNCQQSSMLISENNDKRVPDSKINSEKDVQNELDERLNVECSEQPLEASGADFPPTYDIGPDTQMAAEAIEALCCAPPASYGTADFCGSTKSMSSLAPREAERNDFHSEDISEQKTVSFVELGGPSRQSKTTKKNDTKVSNRARVPSRKGPKKVRKEEPQPILAITGICRNGNQKLPKNILNENLANAKGKAVGICSSEYIQKNGNQKLPKDIPNKHLTHAKGKAGICSYESVQNYRTPEARARLQAKEINPCNGSTLSKENPALSECKIKEGCRTFTPIACRTRRSVTVNPLKVSSSCNKFGQGTDYQIEVGTREGKRRGSRSGVDTPRTLDTERKSSKLGSSQIANERKRKAIQIESPEAVVAQDVARTIHEEFNPLKHPRGKRTCQNTTDYLKKTSNLNGLSTVAHEFGAIEQSVPKRKRSSICGRSVLREKVSKCSRREGETNNLSSAEGRKSNCILEVVPGEEVPSGTGVTALQCTSSVTEVSRTCLGDDYPKRSCKKKTSRPSLKPENITVGPIDAEIIPAPRRRREMTSVRVLFSHHLDEDIIKQQKKISARLGVSVVSSSSEATHFVTDKFARTRNMLEAIALGKPVVTHLWLEGCGQANCFIDEKAYILRDSKKEKEIGFSMPVSLTRASQKPLLQGKRVFATPNVKPSTELIASLVRAVHGQVVERIGSIVTTDAKFFEDLLILSCEEDYEICAPLLEKGAVVYSSELLLNGMVIQKLEYERHRLFSDYVTRMQSDVRSRRDGTQIRALTKCR